MPRSRTIAAHLQARSARGSLLVLLVSALTVGVVAAPAVGAPTPIPGMPRFDTTVPGLGCWDGSFLTELNGDVYALAADGNGNLIAAGAFTTINGVEVNHVAKWDGTTWSALGSGVDSTVFALALDHDGRVFVGGAFEQAGGVYASRLAMWDGSNWSSLGAGMDSSVFALVVDGEGDLVAGGAFSSAGGISVGGIAKWDGVTWSSLDTGMDGSVHALTTDSSGNLYAGGVFTTAGGSGASNIARWDGVAWSAIGTGTNAAVFALTIDAADTLYAGGAFTMAGGVGANRVARWDGSVWSPMNTGFDDAVYALSFHRGYLIAGGAFTTGGGNTTGHLAAWESNDWWDLYGELNGSVYALFEADATFLYAGGAFSSAGGNDASHIAKLVQTQVAVSWSAVDAAPDKDINALAYDAAGRLYVGGEFASVGGVLVNHIARWDGSTWSPLGSGTNGTVSAIAFDSNGNMYVGGSFNDAGGSGARNIAKWDGSHWSTLGIGTDSWVMALAVDQNNNLYAGGTFIKAGGLTVNHIAKWNGSAWSALGSGADDYVTFLTTDRNGILYACGYFTSPGTRIARWNGSSWSSPMSVLPSPIIGSAAVDSLGNVYVGGTFSTLGTVQAKNVAKWNGVKWSSLGAGTNTEAAVFMSPRGELLASGSFTSAGGVSANGLARWGGTSWTALGTGPGTIIDRKAIDGNGTLFLSRKITLPGHDVSIRLAQLGVVAIDRVQPQRSASGGSVLLTGTHLTNATDVQFNGAPATFAASSESTLTAIVPNGATTGLITISGCSGQVVRTGECFRVGPTADIPACAAAGVQHEPVIAPDGTGGSIIAWLDERDGDPDIYVQRITADGTPVWGPRGTPVCQSIDYQLQPAIASDGAGGAIVVWRDSRLHGISQLFGQRINATGAKLWSSNDVAIASTNNRMDSPVMIPDSNGGAIVAWRDLRGNDPSIYAVRVNASGTLVWNSSGIPIGAATGAQDLPVIVSDGTVGGAIIAWQDRRSGDNDIYAQRVNASGVVQWTTNGIPIASLTNDQQLPSMVVDGAGGAILTWRDRRSGDDDIYAQRVNSAGVVQWPSNGVPLCTTPGTQDSARIATDGAGGAIVAWQDSRAGTRDVYAQRVLADGTILPGWTANGVPLCTASGSQQGARVASDGASGAIVVWSDYRGGATADLYAQRVAADGTVQWDANGISVCRATEDQDQFAVLPDATGAVVVWRDAPLACSDIYAQHVAVGGTILGVSDAQLDQPLAEARAWPNPFTSNVSLDFTARVPTPVRLEVLDVAGRRVWTSPITTTTAGANRIRWDGQTEAGPRAGVGIYFLRLNGPDVRVTRTVVRMK